MELPIFQNIPYSWFGFIPAYVITIYVEFTMMSFHTSVVSWDPLSFWAPSQYKGGPSRYGDFQYKDKTVVVRHISAESSSGVVLDIVPNKIENYPRCFIGLCSLAPPYLASLTTNIQ